jgi:hypothetical protein
VSVALPGRNAGNVRDTDTAIRDDGVTKARPRDTPCERFTGVCWASAVQVLASGVGFGRVQTRNPAQIVRNAMKDRTRVAGLSWEA